VDTRGAARWLLGAGAGPAAAAATPHAERQASVAVGEAPLRAGAVVNAHATGPRVYAREQYTLIGARAATAYRVGLLLDLGGAAGAAGAAAPARRGRVCWRGAPA
jgi:hypothetical protein